MTPREIEKTIEFLLQSQARAEVRQDRTDSQIAELAKQNKAMSRETRRLSAKIDKVLARVDKVVARVDKLAASVEILKDTCRDLLDHARWTDARIGRLEESEG